MKKHLTTILISTIIGLIFTAINLAPTAQATDPTILDYSWVENGEVYVGSWDNYISINTNDGAIYIRGRDFYTEGNNTTNGAMNQFYISGTTGKIGAWGAGTNGTMLIFSDEGNEITASPKIAGHQLEP